MALFFATFCHPEERAMAKKQEINFKKPNIY